MTHICVSRLIIIGSDNGLSPVMGLVCLFGNFKQRNFPKIVFDCIIQYWILIHWKYHKIGPFWPYKHCSAKYLSRPSYAHINETSNCFHISDKVTLIWLSRPLFNVYQTLMHSEAGEDWNCQITEGKGKRSAQTLKHIEGRGTLQNETFASYSQSTQYRCHCIIWGCNGH